MLRCLSTFPQRRTALKLDLSQASMLLYPSTVRPVYPVITGVYGKNGGSLGWEMSGQSLAHLTAPWARCHGAGHSGADQSWYAGPASSRDGRGGFLLCGGRSPG